MKLPVLSSKIYTRGYKFPKTSGLVTPLTNHFQAATALLYNTPGWTKDDHLSAAGKQAKLAKKLEKRWGSAWDKAHMKTFGKKPGMWDYKVSGIGRSEYSEADKNILRKLAHEVSDRRVLSRVHEIAASRVNRMKRH